MKFTFRLFDKFRCFGSFLILIFAVLLCTSSASAQTILRVDGLSGLTVSAGATGLDWSHAYLHLQDAIAEAVVNEPDPYQIWVRGRSVANGGAITYKPDRRASQTIGDRGATFSLHNNVGIYGGFNIGDDELTDRLPATNIAILSGDLDGGEDMDGQFNLNQLADNSYHVATAIGVNGTAVIDGFTIVGGMAQCISFPIQSCPPPLDVGFPSSGARGGGLLIHEGASPRVANCVFKHNVANGGAGIANKLNCNPTIVNCIFVHNEAGNAGAIYSIEESAPIIVNCVFNANYAQHVGGALDFRESAGEVVNCTFVGNGALDSVSGFGGAIRSGVDSSPIITNCTFVDNAARYGGAFSAGSDGSSTTPGHAYLRDCILWNNSAYAGGNEIALIGVHPRTLTVSNCDVKGGLDGVYVDPDFPQPPDEDSPLEWGTGNIDANPLIVGAPDIGADEEWGTSDDNYGNLRIQSDSPCINAGLNDDVPPDFADLDSDPTTTITPFDLDGTTRFCHQRQVDMGAYEKAPNCPSDIAPPGGDGNINVDDLLAVINGWGICPALPDGCPGDMEVGCGSGSVAVDDLLAIINTWGACDSPMGFVPESVADCLSYCSGLSGAQYTKCMTECIALIEE